MADDQVVLSERRDGVLLLTLNRPERLNAWTQAMEHRYFDLLEEAATDPDVRVVVVTGAGRGFCAGADMEDLQSIGSGSFEVDERHPRPQTLPLTIPKPIIAAINGPCAGLGLVQALMCDLRFAAADAKLTTAFARRGLVAEHGISWVLPRVVGHARAMDLLLSARVVLGDEAVGMGLVNFSCPFDEVVEQALAYAQDLATNCSPASLATMKRQLLRHWTTELDTALEESNRLMLDSLGAEDFREGVQSFLERRPPRFAGLAAR